MSSLKINRAIEMRCQPTPAEAALWERVRAKRLGVKFRRQHPLRGYIADFCCLSLRLIVEVDGGAHDDRFAADHDAQRDAHLAEAGFRTVRIRNERVLGDLDAVVALISAVISSRAAELGVTLGAVRRDVPRPQPRTRLRQLGQRIADARVSQLARLACGCTGIRRATRWKHGIAVEITAGCARHQGAGIVRVKASMPCQLFGLAGRPNVATGARIRRWDAQDAARREERRAESEIAMRRRARG